MKMTTWKDGAPRLLLLSVLAGVAAGCGGGGGADEDGLDGDVGTTQPGTPGNSGTDFKVLAANDLGMHCADLDYQVFSILPPFNVLHAQVIQRGTMGDPRILTDSDVELFYSASSSADDPVNDTTPAGVVSTNLTSSTTLAGEAKTNFWNINTTGNTLAFDTYGRLYPYDAPLGNSILAGFEPLPVDVGLPVPDLVELMAGNLVPHQQQMPGSGNIPRAFSRFDRNLPFFVDLTVQGQNVGTTITGVNWFAADGIPIVPVDDQGRTNAYPLVKVEARAKGSTTVVAATDVVLPVASEADCQNCHASSDDGYSGIATDFAGTAFTVMTEQDAKSAGLGPEFLLNAAKMNILRLHDAKHGTSLEANRPIQCAQCHYTPALDLAQVGPIDEPAAGPRGRQQTTHVSMSRAMHAFHGRQMFGGAKLFPDMPAPDAPDRATKVDQVLQETCYQCHPGKRTQCLRGAMAAGGVVCQDCHGNMAQVGNDFSGDLSAGNPAPAGLDPDKRIPWASEPACQSCHTGDAVTLNHPAGAKVAADGIRLVQAYEEVILGDGTTAAQPYRSPTSPFAENQSLYRLSKGHGGVMCEGCHGSTHAIFPNPNPRANDNVTAKQLQGHSGTIMECTTCHDSGTLGVTLAGPHGMHPVNDSRWIRSHEDTAERNSGICKSCHGSNGLGTVLSRTPVDRTITLGSRTVSLPKGTEVGCTHCHSNKINGD